MIATALDEHGVSPHCLPLELTETALLKNTDQAVSTMRAMKKLGVKIALDDFGKGYSSLNHLSRLPLDAVKVDQDFIRTLSDNPASVVITDAIIGIGKTLGLGVIAEGVESAETLALLRDRACHEMQGYYLCPPAPADEFERWRRHWQAA